MWTVETWHLHHDSAPAHSSHSIVDSKFLGKHSIPVLLKPPIRLTYPLQIISIVRNKSVLKGRFQMVEDIITSTTDELRAIQQTSF
jgi:hypothetical protein